MWTWVCKTFPGSGGGGGGRGRGWTTHGHTSKVKCNQGNGLIHLKCRETNTTWSHRRPRGRCHTPTSSPPNENIKVPPFFLSSDLKTTYQEAIRWVWSECHPQVRVPQVFRDVLESSLTWENMMMHLVATKVLFPMKLNHKGYFLPT